MTRPDSVGRDEHVRLFLALELPAGAGPLSVPFAAQGLEQAGSRVAFFGPLHPGIHEIEFQYSVPTRAEPAGLAWDGPGLLVVKYGFHTFGLDAASGELRWEHRSASPVLALLGSSRLPHVLVQSEIESFAIEADGTVAWRVAHSDVVTEAELVGGRLVLTSFEGQVVALDPSSGRPA